MAAARETEQSMAEHLELAKKGLDMKQNCME